VSEQQNLNFFKKQENLKSEEKMSRRNALIVDTEMINEDEERDIKRKLPKIEINNEPIQSNAMLTVE
jgi:hypothetical protein